MDVKEAVIQIIADQLGILPSPEMLNKTVVDLGADSLDVVEIVMTIEDCMSCEISDSEAEKYSTLPIARLVEAVEYVANGVDESWLPNKRENSYGKGYSYECHNSSKLLEEFSYAIDKVKNGFRMTRNSWSNQYIFLVPGSTFSVNRAPLNQIFPVGTSITYHSHIDIKYPDGTVGVWFPTQEDLLATDWLLAD